jgi:protein-S-isoprenylcysteine O-methyltransferase Ste14
MTRLILLSVLWLGWCTLHSLLIDPVVIGFIKARFAGIARFYRLLYNALALMTLLPLVLFTDRIGGPLVFRWHGPGNLVRFGLLICAILLFYGGARKYDMQYLLGFRQLRSGESHLLLNDATEFAEDGVFGLVRHPWYLGALLLLWSMSPDYPAARFIAALILSFYLVIGTRLEERKILAGCGDSYRVYQQRVSMLFPWKWLKKKLL